MVAFWGPNPVPDIYKAVCKFPLHRLFDPDWNKLTSPMEFVWLPNSDLCARVTEEMKGAVC